MRKIVQIAYAPRGTLFALDGHGFLWTTTVDCARKGNPEWSPVNGPPDVLPGKKDNTPKGQIKRVVKANQKRFKQ